MDAQTLRRALADFFRFNPKDFRVQGSLTGFLVSLNGRTGAGASPAIPWELIKVDNETIRVRYGTVTTPDGTFTPAGFSPGDDPVFEIAVTGDGVISFYMTVDNTTGEFTAISNPVDDTALPVNTDTEKYLQLGTFSTDVDDILHVQSDDRGSLYAEMCAGVDIIWSAS